MTCREFIEFIWQYLSGELSAAQRAAFDEHIEECPECVAYLHTYETTVQLSRAAFDTQDQADEPVPAEVPESLVQAILTARNVSK